MQTYSVENRKIGTGESWVKCWLNHSTVTDNPVGDIIFDMQHDPDIPRLFQNIAHMRQYIKSRNSKDEVIKLVPKVWQRYREWIHRNHFGCDND